MALWGARRGELGGHFLEDRPPSRPGPGGPHFARALLMLGGAAVLLEAPGGGGESEGYSFTCDGSGKDKSKRSQGVMFSGICARKEAVLTQRPPGPWEVLAYSLASAAVRNHTATHGIDELSVCESLNWLIASLGCDGNVRNILQQ